MKKRDLLSIMGYSVGAMAIVLPLCWPDLIGKVYSLVPYDVEENDSERFTSGLFLYISALFWGMILLQTLFGPGRTTDTSRTSQSNRAKRVLSRMLPLGRFSRFVLAALAVCGGAMFIDAKYGEGFAFMLFLFQVFPLATVLFLANNFWGGGRGRIPLSIAAVLILALVFLQFYVGYLLILLFWCAIPLALMSILGMMGIALFLEIRAEQSATDVAI